MLLRNGKRTHDEEEDIYHGLGDIVMYTLIIYTFILVIYACITMFIYCSVKLLIHATIFHRQ